jgi:uncharacterized secreted repeat protein (TIGR03808 family)
VPHAAAHQLFKPDRSLNQTRRLQDAIDAAGGGELTLGPGTYTVDGLEISRPLLMSGVPGQTILACDADTLLSITGAMDVTIEGISFVSTTARTTLLAARDASRLTVRDCRFEGGARAVTLENSSGRIENNHVKGQEESGIFSNDAKGLMISGNRISDIGNNGIQVWQSEKREDGTIVSGNQVSRIATRAGGTGQNGNGISVYRAGNVIVSGNRISDVAFSGIRNNSGDHCVITGNSISRSAEVAIYVEFSFEGAVVSNNILNDVAFGISVTNFDVGGRMALVTGNVIRRVTGGTADGVTAGGAIHAEADTLVANNVIEDAKDFGISLGWGDKTRNLSAEGNLLRNCNRSITASVTQGAGAIQIVNNVIASHKGPAIVGMDYLEVETEDLAATGSKIPANLAVNGNMVTP